MNVDKGTIQALLVQSGEIDRMRKEIILVVSTLVGLIGKDYLDFLGEHDQQSIGKGFPNNEEDCEFRWSMVVEAEGLFFLFRVKGQPEAHFYDSISTHFVRVVHQHLPLLLQLMLEVFPGLEKKLRAFLDA